MDENCPTCGRPMGDLDAAGKVGTDHPDTSYNAAVTPKFNTQRYRVMEVLHSMGHATAAEVAEAMRLSRNQTATRLLELREGGYAEYVTNDEGRVVKQPTGPSVEGRVQRLTPAGRSVLNTKGA